MMLFIPFSKGTHMSSQYREKILYNHQKYNGLCSMTAVGGLQDLNTEVKLKTGQMISLRSLLKSIPATQGMTRPLLFQHFEPNSSKTVHMAVYQKMDHDHIMERMKTLEGDIKFVLATGEETKVFINSAEGMWYGSVYQNKQGHSVKTTQQTKNGLDYANHINQLLTSPPIKRSPPTTPKGTLQATLPSPKPFVSPPQQFTHPQQRAKPDSNLQQIHEEIAKQKQANTQFDIRIGKLELTTGRIDSNMDRILGILQQNHTATPPRTRKCGRTSDGMECDQENLHNSLIQYQPLRDLQHK